MLSVDADSKSVTKSQGHVFFAVDKGWEDKL